MRKNKKNIGIIGLGSYLPKKVLTNKDLEGMVDGVDNKVDRFRRVII